MGRVYFLADCRLRLVLGMTANMPKTSFIGVVGDENFGREFIPLMEEEHVDTSGVRVAKERELPMNSW